MKSFILKKYIWSQWSSKGDLKRDELVCAPWLEWEENVSRRGSGKRQHVRCPGSDQRGQKRFGHVQRSANEDIMRLILRMEPPGEEDLRLDGQRVDWCDTRGLGEMEEDGLLR